MVMNDRPGVIVQVSSAKQFVGRRQDVLDVTELMKRMKSVGLSGEPWGTPAVGEPGLERESPTFVSFSPHLTLATGTYLSAGKKTQTHEQLCSAQCQ